jgi:hypothetical protein
MPSDLIRGWVSVRVKKDASRTKPGCRARFISVKMREGPAQIRIKMGLPNNRPHLIRI